MPDREPAVRRAIAAETEAMAIAILAERMQAMGAGHTARVLASITAKRRDLAAHARAQLAHAVAG